MIHLLTTDAEDLSFFQKEIRGLFFPMGVTPADQELKTASDNHSPLSVVDDGAMLTGIRSMYQLVEDYMLKNH